MTHLLKVWPEYFNRIIEGDKAFEVRLNDRDYQRGDYLRLQEWDPAEEKFTGRDCSRYVSYVLQGGAFGIHEDYVVMSLRRGIDQA